MKYIAYHGGIVELHKAEYEVRRSFLWVWKVVNIETNRAVFYESKAVCQALVVLLNSVWQNGYEHGRYQTNKL